MHHPHPAPSLPAPGLTDHALNGYRACLEQLHPLGVTVVHARLDDDDARWDPATATMYLRGDGSLADHIRVLTDLGQYIAFGPAASDAQPCPARLYCVPSPP